MNYNLKHSLAIYICAFICWLVPSIIWASVEVDGIYYDLNTTAKTASVASNPNYYTGAVDIPSSFVYNGSTYSVKSISSRAFLSCSELISINFPSSVTTIGSSAFERCTGLTDVVIGSGVTLIDYEAFKNCSNLRSLTLPSSLKTIENETFSGCTSLSEIIAKRTTPPTIVSTTFDGVDKTACMVYVPEGCQPTYAKAANWKTFSNIVERTVLATGSCGDNVTYTIYSDMTMVISGSGAMWDYDWGNHINDDYYRYLKKVIIEEGVTSISSYAFYQCTSLASATIPSGVTSIGSSAFSCCEGLLSVNIPSGVTSIGEGAFSSCSSLTSVTIPNSVTFISNNAFYGCRGLISLTIPYGVTSIGYYAFYDCCSLTMVAIPNSVTSIERYAFYGCSRLSSVTIPYSVNYLGNRVFGGCIALTSIIVHSNNIKYDSRNNCNAIIEKSTNTLIVGCKNSVIPNNITSIGEGAFFSCSDLSSITIPNSVTNISDNAFCHCSGITSLVMSNNLTSIGRGAFYGCSGLSSVTIPNNVTNIGEDVFSDCSSLTSLIVSSSNAKYDSRDNCNAIIETSTNTLIAGSRNTLIPNSVTSIGKRAFSYCNGLTSINIPNGVTSIGEYAFGSCSNLTSVAIPKSVITIDEQAFLYCSGLTSIRTESESPAFLGRHAFGDVDKNICILYVPAGCKEVYGNAYGWEDFQNIIEGSVLATGSCGDNLAYSIYSDMTMVISGTGGMWNYDSDTHINNDYYQSIKKVIFELGVSSIGDMAFEFCDGLTSLTIPNSVTSIGKWAFENCTGLTSVTIPNSVTSIGNGSFGSCDGLTSVTIPDNVNTIGENVFSYCANLSHISVSGSNAKYDSRDNCNAIIETSTNKLIAGCKNTVIPNSVSAIGNYAFLGCTSLTFLDIPSSVSSIGDYSFDHCENLTSVMIPNSVTSIGDHAFEFSGLASVEIPNSVTSIGNYVFQQSSLSSVTIPNSVTSIGTHAFDYCYSLNSVTIPNSVIYIGDYAFANCNLCSVKEESAAPIAINSTVFFNVDKIHSILYVPRGSWLAYSRSSDWGDFQNISEYFNEDVFDVLSSGFCGDNVIFTIYSDMTMVISGTGAMKDFYYEEETESTARENNDYWSAVKNVIIEDGVTSIGNRAFEGCRLMTSISIASSVITIGEEAFMNCAGLTSVKIPNGVTNLDEWTFSNCTSLISIELPNSLTEIGNGTFSECSSLTSVEIPNSVTSIEYGAFSGCRSLLSISIPSSVNNIGDGILSYCNALASISVDPDNAYYDSRSNCNAIIETSTNNLISGCMNTVIPNNVTTIDGAFCGCTGLTSITIPNSVTVIGDDAFNGCSGLTSVEIPKGVTLLGEGAFSGCVNLISIDIPDGVLSITDRTFSNCSSLTSMIIGKGVVFIHVEAFSGCSGLLSITAKGEDPADLGGNESISDFVFYSVNKDNCTLYVPNGCKSKYQLASGWKEFQNIVEFVEESDTDISTLDNALYVDRTEERIGGTMDIPVKLKNNYPVRGFQFTLELPEGANINSWALSNNRLPSGATLSDKIATQKIEGNKITVACSLNYGDATFIGNDGEIATVNVSFGEDMEVGSYPIYLTACDVTTASGVDEDLSDVKATLVLEDYVVGDANGDGKVRIGDATTILNYIVGTTSDKFNEKAADANGDGKIRIGDATTILNIIVNQ